MSFEDPARAPRGRRRHASARRGRGVVWLAAAGGIAVLGLGAVALTGGGGARGPAERDADGGGLPTLIQADPTASGTTPEPDSPPSRTAGPAATGRPGATATASSATPSPSGSAPAAPSASSTPSAEPVPDASDATRSAKPGRGRGNGKGRG
ncbi:MULTISPECIES: hypothetical protein [Streptomyces]|uniref:hypothetical protein n=1 Tax=Streptomyces TaxID=1883 RepID=UPI00202FB050|nr:hypothetical protein [Streptomyces sp. G2]MCM1944185.1 hypothetical protein [Streptomyces sp. G2]